MQEHRLQEHPLEEHRLQEDIICRQEHRLHIVCRNILEHRLQAGTSSAETSSGAAATRFVVDETPDCEEEEGDSPPVTQKTTASQPLDPWIRMWLDGNRRRLG